MKHAHALLGLLSVLVLGACANKDTAEPPAELTSFEPSLQIERVWRVSVGGGAERLRLGLRPASDGLRVYAGGFDGRVVALEADTGREVWSVRTRLPLSAGPGYGAGTLAFGTTNGQLLLLDAETGEERWRTQVGAEVLASPAVGTDTIALRTTDGRLRAFGLSNGAELWSVTQSRPALAMRGYPDPKIAGRLVVAGFENGRLGAYSLDNGEARWEVALGVPTGRTELERLVDVGGEIQVVGNDVFAAGYQGSAIAVDLPSGEDLWTVGVRPRISSFAGLDVDDRRVYVTNDVGYVVAFDRRNAQQLWTQEALRLRDVTAPTRFGGAVVVGDFEGYLHWLDIGDGSIIARAQASAGRVTDAPLIAGSNLVVQTEDGRIAAYRVVVPDEEEE